MKYVNIDPGSIGPLGDPIYSASSADLNLPPGASVKYARLYWGGTRGIGDTVLPESSIDEIYLKVPGENQYRNIANDQPSIGYITTDEESSYQASADITDLVKRHGTGTYTGANMDSVVKPHSWGGWSIAIAYEDPCAPLRHVHLWDGFQPELPNSPALTGTLNGIRTPAAGPVTGHLGWVVYDGDHKPSPSPSTPRATATTWASSTPTSTSTNPCSPPTAPHRPPPPGTRQSDHPVEG
ncbi:hypothetical protein [Kitasatospora purpeofusca]|uniref:hypothetical protein n=1 Tax=Kitasatospora purpeofusca TaxID=67352 RepID=UPI00068F5D05|nr:hypothetical protein [Kitasatospora purpeofusca]